MTDATYVLFSPVRFSSFLLSLAAFLSLPTRESLSQSFEAGNYARKFLLVWLKAKNFDYVINLKF